jgi:membrane protease YdiL (CAAX protease family)
MLEAADHRRGETLDESLTSDSTEVADALRNLPSLGLGRALALHLLPGVAILVLYLVLAPVATRAGAPALFSLLIAVTLVVVGIELGHLLRMGLRRNGRWSLQGVVVATRRTRTLPALAWCFGTVVAAFLLVAATQPSSAALLDRAFSWLPDAYVFTDLDALRAYPRATLIALFALRLPLDGLLVPWVEELYFRGYLQPRLHRFGVWAPLLGHGLFTLYHLWQPWNYPTILVAFLPLAYLVWWTRDVRLGIAVHAAVNLSGGVVTLLALLSGRP